MKAMKHSLTTLTSALLLMGSLSMASLAEEADETLELDAGEDLEFIEIDEILDEDENAPEQIVTQEKPKLETPKEEEEIVDLNQILYGGDAPTDGDEAVAAADKDPETLQQEMQQLKEKILQVNRDLFILEEDLLFPSSTQVNVFVSYDALEYFQLDGVSLKINDLPISNHLYTERELSAMNRGAVQRLFTGNLPVGEHELVAVVTGVGPEGRDYKRAVSLDFEKSSGTKYIELKIEGNDLRKQPDFRLKQWE
ncbi:MAG: hypothetical protein MI808_06755 [Pseudomonadales bacterium]|nr:hypothetical protein [Pseudomonadales bacterium]